MMVKKPRIVIIGAGMAGLTAANKLYKTEGSNELFELCVVEGGNRIGGRINTSEFGGYRIEVGATWIHGIGGNPIYKIAQEINSLESEQPWEFMDGFLDDPRTVAENGYVLNPSIVDPITNLFKKLLEFTQGKHIEGDGTGSNLKAVLNGKQQQQQQSVGSFLRQGLDAYWESRKGQEEVKGYGNWSRKLLEEAIFAMHENTQRTYTSANVLSRLDYNAESEYCMFPGEEITIAKGYLSIIESLASVLPSGVIQLERKVSRIEWQPAEVRGAENGVGSQPVKLYFDDGTTMSADHVILTVSLGVLKAGISEKSGMFNPPLPSFKTQAISRLGFGVVNKLFLLLSQEGDKTLDQFPFLQLVFHQPDSELKHPKIPWWIRRTASLTPIYSNSRVLLSWFAGEEALQLESMKDEEIISGVSTTISTFLSKSRYGGNSDSHEYCNENGNENENGSHEYCNGNGNENENGNGNGNSIGRSFEFEKVLKSQWGTDPLFLGSYSYVAMGSSGDDLDTMAEPLPRMSAYGSSASPPLQLLFAGEATHRTHYSTTHGAYFSGIREANRLLQHYHCY